jgi:predicted nucleic acid-binding protein
MALEYGPTYFADASALVKLVVEENGTSELRPLNAHEVFYTTLLCFSEALGVLKTCRWKKKRLSQEQYLGAANRLRGLVTSGCIKFVEYADLTVPQIFYATADLSDDHRIDLSDALQIVSVQQSHLVDAILITADKGLAKAARKEGIQVWNCEKEPTPPRP